MKENILHPLFLSEHFEFLGPLCTEMFGDTSYAFIFGQLLLCKLKKCVHKDYQADSIEKN